MLYDILLGDDPVGYFRNLPESDHDKFSQVYAMKNAIENPKWHPEGNTFEHTMLVLAQGKKIVDADLQNNPDHNRTLHFQLMLACLVHDFGKALTPPELMPKHHGHEIKGIGPVKDFCRTHNVDEYTTNLVAVTTRYHMYGHNLDSLRHVTLAKMFKQLDNFKGGWRILYALFCADARGRLGYENTDLKYLNKFLSIRDDWEYAKTNSNRFLKMII